ncbi:MAG: TlpA family protein disulfide reductase [Chlorobi bacterium]|nr:TlpA family protein disulfide reductase [Chlorobiota bacterium]
MKRFVPVMLIFFSVTLMALSSSILNIRLRKPNGQPTTLKPYVQKHKYTVLVFWATWCVPCKKELPAVEKYYPKWKEKGIEVIGISIDNARNMSRAQATAKSMNLSFPILMDPNQDLMRALGIRAIPHTAVLNAQGEIVFRHQGYVEGDVDKLNEKLMELLSK